MLTFYNIHSGKRKQKASLTPSPCPNGTRLAPVSPLPEDARQSALYQVLLRAQSETRPPAVPPHTVCHQLPRPPALGPARRATPKHPAPLRSIRCSPHGAQPRSSLPCPQQKATAASRDSRYLGAVRSPHPIERAPPAHQSATSEPAARHRHAAPPPLESAPGSACAVPAATPCP